MQKMTIRKLCVLSRHNYNEVSNACLTHIVIKILFTNEEAKKVVKHAFKVNKSLVKKDNDTDPKIHIFAILLFNEKFTKEGLITFVSMDLGLILV